MSALTVRWRYPMLSAIPLWENRLFNIRRLQKAHQNILELFFGKHLSSTYFERAVIRRVRVE